MSDNGAFVLDHLRHDLWIFLVVVNFAIVSKMNLKRAKSSVLLGIGVAFTKERTTIFGTEFHRKFCPQTEIFLP